MISHWSKGIWTATGFPFVIRYVMDFYVQTASSSAVDVTRSTHENLFAACVAGVDCLSIYSVSPPFMTLSFLLKGAYAATPPGSS